MGMKSQGSIPRVMVDDPKKSGRQYRGKHPERVTPTLNSQGHAAVHILGIAGSRKMYVTQRLVPPLNRHVLLKGIDLAQASSPFSRRQDFGETNVPNFETWRRI